MSLDVENATGSYSANKLLDNLKFALDRYLSAIMEEKTFIDAPYLLKIANGVDFNFFHVKEDSSKPFLRNAHYLSGDHDLSAFKKSNEESFHEKAKFFRGCVQISPKASEKR